MYRHWGARKVPGYEDFGFLKVGDRTGVAFGPVGAPNAAIRLEELRAHGIRQFVAVGTAGSLQPDLDVGEIVLCSRAIRDEGTSHHYARPALYADSSPGLTRRLRTTLESNGIPFRMGISWTTDAPYRETVPEIVRYRHQGVLTVEMEAAAIFAVAARLGVSAGALFVVSDRLDESRWQPRFHDVGQDLKIALKVALKALS